MTLYSGSFNPQKITGTAKVLVAAGGNFESISLTNIHASDAATVDLYVASSTGRDITATDVVSAEAEAVSTASVTLTVDDGSGSASDAANDELLNEKVYKSDGTFFGTCTTVSSTTALVFSGGLTNAIANNDILHTGTRYYILKTFSIPVASTLVLDSKDVSFNNGAYQMYIKLGAGTIDLISRH